MNSLLSLKNLTHSHHFDTSNPIAKKNTLYATLLTFITMVFEIFGGTYFNSMALLADGWHMSSHVLALGMAYMAYVMAHKYAHDMRFNFGTYKIEVLGGYTSAILLLVVAFFMVYQSVERIFYPAQIAYKEAIVIAIIGLVVNLICAWLLKDDHHHEHHDHDHAHHHHDLNLKAAYMHVLADAMTSVLAIVALFGGMLWGADWLDPTMGIVGSVLVFIWAIGIIKQSGKILLDATMDEPIVQEIIDVINDFNDEVILEDLHVWKVGKGKFAAIITLNCVSQMNANAVREALAIHEELVHISVELNQRKDDL